MCKQSVFFQTFCLHHQIFSFVLKINHSEKNFHFCNALMRFGSVDSFPIVEETSVLLYNFYRLFKTKAKTVAYIQAENLLACENIYKQFNNN